MLEQAQSPPTRPYPCLPTVSSSQLPPFRALPSAGTSYITWKYLETMPCPQHLGGPGRGLAGTEMLYRDGGTAWAHFHSCGLASARPQLRPPARLPPLPHLLPSLPRSFVQRPLSPLIAAVGTLSPALLLEKSEELGPNQGLFYFQNHLYVIFQ